MVAEGDGIGARCVRKSSDVRGSPPKTGISGEGASPPKTGISGEGTSPPKPTSGTGQEGVVSPHAWMRQTPRSSGSDRAEAPETSSAIGGRGRRERKSASVDMRDGSYRPREIPSCVGCAVWFLPSCRFAEGTDGQ